MPCIVKKTLDKIVKAECHYLVKVKANQPKLLVALEETLVESESVDYFMEEAISRRRLEIRQTYLYERKENLPQGWQSISRIAYVHRIRLTKTGEHTSDSFYVSDLETDDAKYMATGIRSHWGIENKLHYTKDVTMREDRECTANKKAASNLALFRDFAFKYSIKINDIF